MADRIFGQEGKKFKAVLLLNWLLEGHTVEIEGRRWCIADDGRLGVLGYNEDGTDSGRVMICDMEMSAFVAMADRIPDDDLFVKGCEFALRDMALERREASRKFRETYYLPNTETDH